MKRIFIFILILIFIASCKSSKNARRTNVIVKKPKSTSVIIKQDPTNGNLEVEDHETTIYETVPVEQNIINYAKTFEGVRYRFGGTDYKGVDCSGLVFEAFRANDILLPRISRDMAKQGEKIKLKDTKKGDLLFFKTGNRRNTINHVGIVTEIKDNNIYFIHSTTSKGVIISSLNEDYWLNTFSEVRSFL